MEVLNLLKSPDIKHVHFIGIGGISMSGLAEIMLNMGYEISGSDIRSTSITHKLESLGVKIYTSHSEGNITHPDLVVYTAAVKENNPELVRSRELNIPVIDRATLLGQIMGKYPYSVAVAGTHGKTTTSSMITTIMLECGMDPTVHIGGELNAIGGGTRIGGDSYFVAEACEYYESFLKFHPHIAVILNIDFDHADYYKNIEHVRATFLKFASQVPANGYIVAYQDDPSIASLLQDLHCNTVFYGIEGNNAMWSAKNITFDDFGYASYILMQEGREVCDIKLGVPGVHNVNNSLAAIAACHILGCNLSSIKQGLANFHGANRRFELKGISNDVRIIDDYAHHPSEIKATLKAARNISHSRIWCVFQPHTYTRTKSFFNEFASSFSDADTVILTDIYAAREVDKGEINSKMLEERINGNGCTAIYIDGFESIAEYLQEHVLPGDIIITMGAGDIYKVGELFLRNRQVMAAI